MKVMYFSTLYNLKRDYNEFPKYHAALEKEKYWFFGL
jgi:hypothetical protein